MARNYKELQEKMDPASRSDNAGLVRQELERMAIDELRNAKRLTQADMAEMLGVPQSSISRIEQRADMYLSTLRNYVHAVGGVLQIRAVFPDGGTVTISRLGDYDDQSYVVRARSERDGVYSLDAQPLEHGEVLSTKALKVQAFTRTLKALHIPEPEISTVRKSLEPDQLESTGGSFTFARRVFNAPELIAAGFIAEGKLANQ